jgi:hypothetical protein
VRFPPGNGSLPPVALGATAEVTRPSTPSRPRAASGGSASRQAATRGNAEQKLTRDEVAQVVAAVRAKRPVPTARPDPISIDLDGCTVTIKWKKGEALTAQQALRKALKVLQDRDRNEHAA